MQQVTVCFQLPRVGGKGWPGGRGVQLVPEVWVPLSPGVKFFFDLEQVGMTQPSKNVSMCLILITWTQAHGHILSTWAQVAP